MRFWYRTATLPAARPMVQRFHETQDAVTREELYTLPVALVNVQQSPARRTR